MQEPRGYFSAHGDSPTSVLYFSEATKQSTLVAFSRAGKPLGKPTVAPHGIAIGVAK